MSCVCLHAARGPAFAYKTWIQRERNWKQKLGVGKTKGTGSAGGSGQRSPGEMKVWKSLDISSLTACPVASFVTARIATTMSFKMCSLSRCLLSTSLSTSCFPSACVLPMHFSSTESCIVMVCTRGRTTMAVEANSILTCRGRYLAVKLHDEYEVIVQFHQHACQIHCAISVDMPAA